VDICHEPGITKGYSQDDSRDIKARRRKALNARSPQLDSETDLYIFALESADDATKRSKSGLLCSTCGLVISEQSTIDPRDKHVKYHELEVVSMKKEWYRRSYLTICWDTLPEHLRSHVPLLLDTLYGRFPTPFQQRYEDQMRNLKDYGTTTTRSGYYGPRGESLMSVPQATI
jgi:hypothetical protein